MEFCYKPATTYEKEIIIDNIHQVALKAIDDKGFSYYLVIRTLLGQCSTVQFGPLVDGDPIVPDSTSINFSRFDSNEGQLKKLIRSFLAPRNNGRNKIEEVYELSFDEVLNEGIDLLDYMRKFNEVSNY